MKCPKCNHDVIEGHLSGAQRVLLDPIPRCYTTVEVDRDFPEDGDRLVIATALVVHSVVCPVELREQAQQREDGKRQYAARQKAKAGR